MKKYLFKIFFLVVIFTAITSFVSASTLATEYASVISSSELSGWESEMATTLDVARLCYQHRGYKVFQLKDPEPLTLLSNLTSSRVQLFYCHGGTDFVQFPTCGIWLGESNQVVNGREFYPAKNVDWRNKKLVTLAACKTAGNGSPDSFAIAQQIAELGAQATIGWYSKIWTFSSCDWLDNFHDRIYKGYSPLDSVAYANSKIYAFPTIKDNTISYRTLSALSEDSIMSQAEFNSDDNLLAVNEIGTLNVSQSENLIKKNNSDFDINQYEKQVSEGLYVYNVETGETKKLYGYVDYNLKVGDFISNSGYTVVLDENDNILQIVDNTVDIQNEISRKSSNYYSISNLDDNYYLEKARSQLSDQDVILNEDIVFGYDVNTNKKYAYVNLEVQHSFGLPQDEFFSFEIE